MDDKIREMIHQFSNERTNLLAILEKVQETEHCILPETLKEIGRHLHMSENEIYSIASFFDHFRFSDAASPEAVRMSAFDAAPRPGEVRIALRNWGEINPENLNDYKTRDGYSGLAKALAMTPDEVIGEIADSGLRGRGGAGFPTADKWHSCLVEEKSGKYFICNALQSDREAAAVCILLENDPHAVLEGMLIGAYATGATRGIVAINAEYVLAVSRLGIALQQLRDAGLSGDAIMGSGFSFHIEMAEVPAAIICGEETALIKALEGRRPAPGVRPPFPTSSGFSGVPSVINNAETLAHVSAILQKGSAWYSGYGTAGNSGTKMFTLTGSVASPGVVEVPLGTTLRAIIFDLGGGIPNGKDFKAVRTGGITGGFLSSTYLDTPVEYESLAGAGSIMGSGTLSVTDSDACAVDIAREVLSVIEKESCGKCVHCREGAMQLAEMLTDIAEGRGQAEDMNILVDLGEAMKEGALCAFGRTAPNPVLTTVRDFRDEYEAHIRELRCPAKFCGKIESVAQDKK